MCQSQSKIVCLGAGVDKKGNTKVSRQGGGQPLRVVRQVVVEEPGNMGFASIVMIYQCHLEFVFNWAICS